LIRFAQKGKELGINSSHNIGENGQIIPGLETKPKGNHIIYTTEHGKPYEFSSSRLTVRLIQYSEGIGYRKKLMALCNVMHKGIYPKPKGCRLPVSVQS